MHGDNYSTFLKVQLFRPRVYIELYMCILNCTPSGGKICSPTANSVYFAWLCAEVAEWQ